MPNIKDTPIEGLYAKVNRITDQATRGIGGLMPTIHPISPVMREISRYVKGAINEALGGSESINALELLAAYQRMAEKLDAVRADRNRLKESVKCVSSLHRDLELARHGISDLKAELDDMTKRRDACADEVVRYREKYDAMKGEGLAYTTSIESECEGLKILVQSLSLSLADAQSDLDALRKATPLTGSAIPANNHQRIQQLERSTAARMDAIERRITSLEGPF